MSSKQKINSSIPGLAYPLARNEIIKTPYGFLKGRTQQDGAEGLWRIRNGLYDLRTFAKSHPGGAEWITLTKGTDITEAFEAHHLTEKAERILPKFYIRDATTLRSIPLTFEPNGFYHTFKKRALEALKGVDFHRPSKVSNFIADSFLAATVFFCLASVYSHILSFIAIIIAGFFLAWTAVIGHNYFHMRDNFRMYYFDLSLMSSKDWRITHVLSHHLYPNTLWDYEMYAIEPFLKWLPDKNKNIITSFISQLSSPIIYTLTFIQQGVKSFIGFNAAHHHPNIFHDGDIYRENLDWGLLELDAVREREIIDDVPLLVLTNFGSHGLHHLLPAVDHSYLPLTMPAFLQTCKEFGISTKRWTQWELLKGQFKQLARVECKKNHR
uniref:cytochrome b5-related protein isoform X2 n=1 Tax=Vespula vulgaris TaxID=7454 RepID=UPI00223B1E9D|nr:cytochrome b5-related protein isoform X2 [Vespula vulgaris]